MINSVTSMASEAACTAQPRNVLTDSLVGDVLTCRRRRSLHNWNGREYLLRILMISPSNVSTTGYVAAPASVWTLGRFVTPSYKQGTAVVRPSPTWRLGLV